MPWTTPTLGAVRRLVRDAIAAYLPGANATVPNSTLRVLAESNAGLAHLNLKYLDWLAKQLLPDTSEGEWLRRWAEIVLKAGPKPATPSVGAAIATGIAGSVIPAGAQLTAPNGAAYETTAAATLGAQGATISLQATTAGTIGNQVDGAQLSLAVAISGVDARVVVISLMGGADAETDDELRVRVLDRLRKPPMGGDADDYVAWALEVPGVTRAWCSPQEMGLGTVTVRFMMDDLRATAGGFPNAQDVAAVQAHLETRRPVTARDVFAVAPVPEPINLTLYDLEPSDTSTIQNIETSMRTMLRTRAAPAYTVNGVPVDAQTIYAVWVSEAVSAAAGVEHFRIDMADHEMPTPGSLAVPGTIILG